MVIEDGINGLTDVSDEIRICGPERRKANKISHNSIAPNITKIKTHDEKQRWNPLKMAIDPGNRSSSSVIFVRLRQPTINRRTQTERN